MADVCGPWTLDQLDAFGTVDSIPITFDSPIWQSADTCILASDASVLGKATTVAFGNGIFAFVASATAIATVTADGLRIRTSSASVSGTASVLLDAIRQRFSSASVIGKATTDALGGVEYLSSASVAGVANATATAFAILISEGSIIGKATLFADGTVIGEEWADVPIGTEVWTFRGSGICGPFTLDQLDVFGGVNELPFSLDNPIYLREDFCAPVELWQKNPEGTNTWLRKG